MKKRNHATTAPLVLSILTLILACWGCTAAQPSPSSASTQNASNVPASSSDAGTSQAPSSKDPASLEAAHSSESSSSPLVPSPELLAKNDTSSSAAETLKAPGTFNFTGAYAGTLDANAMPLESYGETIEATVPDHVAALAQNSGALSLAGGKLIKMGDGTDDATNDSYGTNAAAVAVGPGSLLTAASETIETAATGAFALFAVNQGGILTNETSLVTSHDNAGAARAAYGGTFLANAMSAQTSGANSPALSAGSASSGSVTNSILQTSGARSAIVRAAGRMELDNCTGTTAASPACVIEEAGATVVANSKLTTESTGKMEGEPADGAIMLCGVQGDAADADNDQISSFHISDSRLVSFLTSGSLFHLTNIQANIVLSNTRLDFDESASNLLTAAGNNVTGWGTAGRNGAEATFTAKNQKLKGDAEVDSISSVDFYLLEGSRWEGSSSILSNTAGAAVADNLSVSIDGSSTWVVTENSTVSDINLATGGKLVDTKGNSVKLVDRNGLTLVDGASSVTITVTGGFSTTVKTSTANDLQQATIDRAALDNAFGISTAFGTNGTSAATPDEQRVAALIETVKAWFANL